MAENRFEVAYGKMRGAVLVKDTTTGEVRAMFVTDDALLNATTEAARLNRQDREGGWR